MRKRCARVCAIGLLTLLVVWGAFIYRGMRQEQLNNALVSAVRRNDPFAVRSLLYQGANPNAPIMPADSRSFWQRLWDMLRQKPPPYSLDHVSVLDDAVNTPYIDNADSVQVLVEAGAEVNFRDRHRNTPLITAVISGKWRTVQILLDHHADVNAADAVGTTALMAAALGNNVKTVEALLNRGANVNARDYEGTTALMRALYLRVDRQKERETAACLLRHGASVRGQGKGGETVLSLVRDSDDRQLIRMLQQAGAK